MLSQHKVVFFDVAQRLTCWIGLREPNPLSDRWIGRPGGVPKGETCKAKTADNQAFRYAGLVVDPTRCPEAFKPASLAAATSTWNQFSRGGRLPPEFTCVEDGPEKGLVKLRGSYIFADYDLMAVNRAGEGGGFLTTSQLEQRRLFEAVKPALNRGLRVPMIQHGPEMMWQQGVGGREFEYVLWFGPGRRFNRWPSSMPRGGH
jgi:hypothetical protein